MNRTCRTFISAVAVLAGSLVSHAQFYTIAPGGPTPIYVPDTVYIPGGPPPLTGAGAGPAFVGPPPPNPPGFYIIDGLSSGADAGSVYLFSSMAGAGGAPGSPVFFQTTVGSGPSQVFPGPPGAPAPPEAAGDIFRVPSGPLPGPVPAFGALAASTPLAFAPPPLFTDEFFLSLNVGPGGPDDLNGLTYRAPGGALGFYYSLAVGGLGGSGALPADILNAAGIFAPSFALSLDLPFIGGPGADDIDAILVQDLGIVGVYEPGIDFVAFSLAPGSGTLGAFGGGVYAPGGGDLLVPDGADLDPFPDIFIPFGVFGLLPGDNLDAIDVVPEPATGALLLLAGGCFALGRSRQNRRS